MGRMTSFGYGTTGSLYSYAYTYDNAWRPATMTGESLTLVSGINYNAAGAMTAFTRDDGSGTAVNNAYTFNTLYQMTNQTVTQGRHAVAEPQLRVPHNEQQRADHPADRPSLGRSRRVPV